MNTENMIFVFGSNLSGIHGAGAAHFAMQKMGAIYGQGRGLQGQSYALPTKGKKIEFMPLHQVAGYVDDFLDFARSRPDLEFQVTQIGCGLAGFKPEQIAPLFKAAPDNCYFDIAWLPFLSLHHNFWNN